MSLEGGFDELPEFFLALANSDSNSSLRFSSAATLASSSAFRRSRSMHPGQTCGVGSAMMAVTYPRALKSSKISFWPVNGYAAPNAR
jgi:hypothetical protein